MKELSAGGLSCHSWQRVNTNSLNWVRICMFSLAQHIEFQVFIKKNNIVFDFFANLRKLLLNEFSLAYYLIALISCVFLSKDT